MLVYLYLVRTAEQKADEALLSINSFQKDLAHQNPRVRALALRVMSSIRVQVIVPVVILAVRKCAVDPSPYVRKAAAHAIPKVFRLDPKRKDELTEIIETMLRDSTPFVLSSAVAAFQEVCPDRIDLIHRHYRKMCRMLVDCDEWGQILLANLLLRYARTQFTRPDAYDRALTAGGDDDDAKMLELQLPGDGGAFEKASSNPLAGTKGFYSSSDSDSEDEDEDEDDVGADEGSGGSDSDVPRAKKPPAVAKKKSKKKSKKSKKGPKKGPKPTKDAASAAADRMGSEWLDDDHRLLLRSSRPLLQSQNTAVVMAAASLQFYLAPVADLPKVLRALVFAMRMKPEAQHVMLKNICTMVAVQSSLFQVHFASFFVHPADPVDVRALKLEILTHVVTSDNAAALLRELQSYLRSTNHEFVALTIRAIGRCAAIMPQIASVCIRSLLELSLHPSEEVAGEAVVVIRALVQQNPKEHAVIVMRLVRRLEMLAAPAARSAVAWLAGGELYIFGEPASTALAGALPEALPEATSKDAAVAGPDGFVATQVSMLESSLVPDSPKLGTTDSEAEGGDPAIDALIAAAAGGEDSPTQTPHSPDAGSGALAVVDEKAAKKAAKKAEKTEKKRIECGERVAGGGGATRKVLRALLLRAEAIAPELRGRDGRHQAPDSQLDVQALREGPHARRAGAQARIRAVLHGSQRGYPRQGSYLPRHVRRRGQRRAARGAQGEGRAVRQAGSQAPEPRGAHVRPRAGFVVSFRGARGARVRVASRAPRRSAPVARPGPILQRQRGQRQGWEEGEQGWILLGFGV